MIDITLIREKPDWVKQQIRNLNDEVALARVDAILALDKQRRELLTESEAIQAARNRLNKSVGRLRGDKALDSAVRAMVALRTSEAIGEARFDDAVAIIENPAAQAAEGAVATDRAMDDLMTALKGMGERVESINEEITKVEAELE